jgi:hypothetical protein
LVSVGYPIPVKPKTPINDLQLPEDVEALNPIQLANLLMRLQAWYAYSTAQLAFARAELHAFDEYFSIELGDKMNSLASLTEGRPTKDVLKALALKTTAVGAMFTRKLGLEQRAELIEGMVQSLSIQCKALTTEQIRRHAAQKLSHGESF